MARRHIHYEAAFEDYLRSSGAAYLAVDEQRKAIFSGARVKSFDFLVYRRQGETWLVDVKGRKFPYESPRGRRYWENWLTCEDVDGLRRWQDVFGEGFISMAVFTYVLADVPDRLPTRHVHAFAGRRYAFLAVPIDEYARHARQRSEKWQTLFVPTAAFRRMAEPIQLM